MRKSAFLPQIIVAGVAALAVISITGQIAARTLSEYTAAEARRHVGETATVVGKVDCLDHGRRHTDVLIGGCDRRKTLLWIVVPEEVSGSELDCGQLRGVTIAVTGKIESSGGIPLISIKSASQIAPRTPLNPDYFASAMEKQSRGDLDGAIADLDRAVELTHEADLYVQRAEVKQKKGDLDGTISDYDQLLEHHPNHGVYYLNRARLKMKKSDYAGVIADCSRGIELFTHYYASHPNDHSTFMLAQAYSERGEAKQAMGDHAGAVRDYENAITNDPNASMYKEKLKRAQAEVGRKHEQSSNRGEATPESVAEAFVQAYSGADVDALASLYADRVDYTNSGVISNAAVRAQAQKYFTRWPVRRWSLVGPVTTTSIGPSRQKVIFSASYDVTNPQTNKHASGIAKETLILTTDASGVMKIVSQKEQLSKGRQQPVGESDQKTAEVPGFEAAKAEYQASSHDETARMRYVTRLGDLRDQVMRIYSETGDKAAASDQAAPIDEELRKHPMPRSVDSRKLKQLLIGQWDSPRHTYVFRADNTYGVSDEQRDKWRIEGNEFIDDFSRAPIILLDRNHFIYAFGQGVMVYTRANEQSSSQADEETSEGLDSKAAKGEASKKQPVANPSQPIAPAQAQTGSPGCTSDPKSVWSEASPDKRLLATIRFVQNPDQNCRACDELKITVFRRGSDGKPGQILASTAILGCFLQCAHWSLDSQFLLFTTSLSRGAHGGWHYATFVYCAGDQSFRGDLEDVFGNVLAPDFHFESSDIAVLTVSDDHAPSSAGEEPPTKQVRVSLGKVVDKLDRLPRS